MSKAKVMKKVLQNLTPNSKVAIEREGVTVDSRNSEENIAKVALDSASDILNSLKPGTKQSVTDIGRNVYKIMKSS